MDDIGIENTNLEIARAWCAEQGPGWAVLDTAGRGGTAPVFTVQTPDGDMALKLYDARFSEGEQGAESERRIKPQIELGLHDCPYIVRVFRGGRFSGRLFILMDKAPGQELEKRLPDVPRDKIRQIMHQLAEACLFLRGKGLCHRDIKSANIFITDDFEKVTLLDLSVLRDVYDPVGLGTDHGGELPVVATSRYSPPEYLFRLIPADETLWHALDIYQLGGVLHDLIMREPMFHQEYLRSRDSNRYRFAWIVATVDPQIQAVDVDNDLIILTKRALDKNWERRSQLQLEDFRNTAAARQHFGLEVLGLVARSPRPTVGAIAIRRRLTHVAEAVEAEIVAGLRSAGVISEHQGSMGASDSERNLTFRWEPPGVGREAPLSGLELSVRMRRLEDSTGIRVQVAVSLSAQVAGVSTSRHLDLPAIRDAEHDGLPSEIAASALGILGELGAQIVAAQGGANVTLVGS